MAQSRVGTPLYLAPELVKRQPYDLKVDVWAMGVLMYTLASHRGPFKVARCFAHGTPL
jgi:serine/threonine protein kinase